MTDQELKLLYTDDEEIERLSKFSRTRVQWLRRRRQDAKGFPAFVKELGYKIEIIEQKAKKGKPFSHEELQILYEKYHYFQSVEYKIDTQEINDHDYQKEEKFKKFVTEIVEQRDRKKDLAAIHGINREQIADHEADIGNTTVVFVGDLKIKGFEEEVPPSLKVIYGSFDISECHIE